jgi:hypothetical protein
LLARKWEHPVKRDEDVEYRRAASKYSASLMSNAKWRKLFNAVIDAGVVIERARWRFIDSDHTIEVSFPLAHDLREEGFADGKFQPFEYRWIEAVYVPNTFKPTPGVGYEVKQNTAGLVAALEKAGEFPIEEGPDGITIVGYRRQVELG